MKISYTMKSLIITLSTLRAIVLASPTVVSLTSSLNGRSRAYDRQEIIFTCTTRGSQIISWSSNDYIGQDLQLEFISVDQVQSSIQSRINSDTIATLVSVNAENGSLILESTLRIIASSQFPSSSINCHHIGSGQINSTNIQVAAQQAQELNCTLRQGYYACPGERLTFTCQTRGSDVLAWSSDEYIGQDQQIEFLSFEESGTTRTSPVDPNNVALLTNISQENGTLAITCNLSITVLPSIDHQNHSVTCINVGLGTRNVTTFYLADDCDQSISIETVTMVEKATVNSSEVEPNVDDFIAAGICNMPYNKGLMVISLSALLLYSF